MMFRPSHPRVMNYRPRFNPRQHSQQRPHLEPRAFYGRSNHFRPRLPQTSQNSNLEHWCETCDRGFLSAKHLEDHKLQHQKCNIDGCQFIAHPNVITKHIQMQHSSGLYKKISNLSNPEEIKKWREERKKNFPTRSNIEKKKAELKEKIDRGEKMGLRPGQRFNDSKPGHKRKVESNNKSHCNIKDFKKKKYCNQNDETEGHKFVQPRNTIKYFPHVDEKNKIPPFSGIHGLIKSQGKDDTEEANSNLLFDDDNEVVAKETHESCNIREPVLCGALVALMGQYGSSDEEKNENDSKQVPNKLNINKWKDKRHIKETKDSYVIPEVSSNCDINDDHESGPEEIKVVKIVAENDNEDSKKDVKIIKKKQLDKNDNRRLHIKRKPKPPSSLLQKLLFKEMQHERNLILQCVRYIIKNKYFEE